MSELCVNQSLNASPAENTATVTNRGVIYASVVAFVVSLFSVYDFILLGTLLSIIAQEFKWSTATSTGIATWDLVLDAFHHSRR